jgi:hypothetical protein
LYSFYLNSKDIKESKKDFFLKEDGTMKIFGRVLFQDKELFKRIKKVFSHFKLNEK